MNALPTYDCIVLGTGGIGGAALYHLARRGARVLGVDALPPGHDRGSSHGQTRLIRLAYFEHPDYVPLLRRSYALWEALEAEHCTRLYRETGVIQIGPPEGVVVSGVRRAAREHALRIEDIDSLPGLRWPDSMAAVYEARAGILAVEECVRAHCAAAERAGATLRIGEAVTDWAADGEGVVVRTRTEEYRAARLVIAAGAWASGLIGDLALPLRVLRKSLFWYEGDPALHSSDAGLPAFYFELPNGHFYGFPSLDERGIKVAEHTGGSEVDDPATVDREIDRSEQSRVESFLASHVPDAKRDCRGHAVCLYTVTPDRDFIIDRHPLHPHVVFAAGLSGHGFKFAPVLGEALADLALDGATRLPIGFLTARRYLDA